MATTKTKEKCSRCGEEARLEIIVGEAVKTCFPCIELLLGAEVNLCGRCERPALNREDVLRRSRNLETSLCFECAIEMVTCGRCNDYEEPPQIVNGRCRSCVRSTTPRIMLRHFNKNCKDYLGNANGKIIQSLRTFGIELEVINRQQVEVAKFSTELSDVFGLDRDGSIQGDNGVEIVSPILSGDKGEEAVENLCSMMKKHGFEVNTTCGFHVHLSGNGFMVGDGKTLLRHTDLGAFLANAIKAQKGVGGSVNTSGTVFIQKEVYQRLKGNNSNIQKALDLLPRLALKPSKQLSTPFHQLRLVDTKGDYNLGLNSKIGLHVAYVTFELPAPNGVQITDIPFYFYPDTEYVKRIETVRSKMKELSLMPNDLYLSKTSNISVAKALGDDPFSFLNPNRLVAPEDTVVLRNGVRPFQNLKTLLYLYTVYNDVFLSMLPRSRQSHNTYCQKLYNSFSPNDILSLGSYEALERLWYKTSDYSNKESRKGGKYDPSRYHGVNLHSLFGQNKTIEIRWASGTINKQNILYWTSLHQTILDKISNGEVDINRLQEGAEMFNLDDKRNHLLEVLNLRKALVDYINIRTQFFSNNIK